jgi:hypothetical protein
MHAVATRPMTASTSSVDGPAGTQHRPGAELLLLAGPTTTAGPSGQQTNSDGGWPAPTMLIQLNGHRPRSLGDQSRSEPTAVHLVFIREPLMYHSLD